VEVSGSRPKDGKTTYSFLRPKQCWSVPSHVSFLSLSMSAINYIVAPKGDFKRVLVRVLGEGYRTSEAS
jgi:hypothetical protein